MATAIWVTVLGIGFFITLVSFIYRKAEYKYLPKAEIKKLNIFNSPAAWLLYSSAFAIIIGIIFVTSYINMISGISNVGKQRDTLIEQQQQQQTDSSEP